MLEKDKYLIKLGKKKKRRRGPAAKGKTNGRGTKGQKARSGGGKPRPGFEGGQTPIFRRLPKRGFNHSKEKIQLLNLDKLQNDINILDGQKINLSDGKKSVKVLRRGKEILTKKLTIVAAAFSKSARVEIEKAGGKAEIIDYAKKK